MSITIRLRDGSPTASEVVLLSATGFKLVEYTSGQSVLRDRDGNDYDTVHAALRAAHRIADGRPA